MRSFKIENFPEFVKSFRKRSLRLLISFSLKVERVLNPVFFLSSTKSFSFEKKTMYSWFTALMALVIYFFNFWITEIDFLLKFSMLGNTSSSYGLISTTSGESDLSSSI